MLDYLVLYNSQSGNTKRVAAAIFSALPEGSKDLIDINVGKPLPEAETCFIGFCVHRGTCCLEVSDLISSLQGRNIALFGARAGCPCRCARNTRPCAAKKTPPR